jgi:hypothetical protein
VAFTAVASVLLVILAMLPFAVGSVVTTMVQPSLSTVYNVTGTNSQPAPTHSRLSITMVGLDQWSGLLTLRVSGTHVCNPRCDWDDRFLFVATRLSTDPSKGLPPSQSVTFPPTARELSQEIQLPIAGNPIRFPFDEYSLDLGVIMERVYPDGTTDVLSPQEAEGHLFVTLQSHVPLTTLSRITAINPEQVPTDAEGYQYADVEEFVLVRPLYVRIMSVLLVLLVSAAAAYAVFMQPLDQLVLNSGALILGVWGIRSILLGFTLPGLTAVDLALSLVILFLLVAMTWRAFQHLHVLSGHPLGLRRRSQRSDRGDPPAG